MLNLQLNKHKTAVKNKRGETLGTSMKLFNGNNLSHINYYLQQDKALS